MLQENMFSMTKLHMTIYDDAYEIKGGYKWGGETEGRVPPIRQELIFTIYYTGKDATIL